MISGFASLSKMCLLNTRSLSCTVCFFFLGDDPHSQGSCLSPSLPLPDSVLCLCLQALQYVLAYCLLPLYQRLCPYLRSLPPYTSFAFSLSRSASALISLLTGGRSSLSCLGGRGEDIYLILSHGSSPPICKF